MHSEFPTARIKPKERVSNMDKPSLTNRLDRPVTEKKVTPSNNCDHLYRDFRTESINGKVSSVFFYCQRCLDIVVKGIK
ncbi:hypothetical protein NCCP28_06090 [Niallia sp. NCCP-28]|nr:hypothetical protein NCCP28_06090 [Niallia sp. NCCP-28]